MKVKWIDIPDYEGMYQLSSDKQVKSLPRYVKLWGNQVYRQGKILNQFKKKHGFPYVNLNRDGKQKQFSVERLYQKLFEGKTFEKTSNHDGVYLKKGRWQATAYLHGKQVWISSHKEEYDAYLAREAFMEKEGIA